MVSQSKIRGLLNKYNDPATSAGERAALGEKLAELGVIPPTTRALVPSGSGSSSETSIIDKIISGARTLYDWNKELGDPFGAVVKWTKEKVKNWSEKQNAKVPVNETTPDDVLAIKEQDVMSSSTTYPRMLPAAMYKPLKRTISRRAYESMLPRRRYRRGMFGHNTYNNLGFFGSFISPSNRRFSYF